MRNLFRKLIGAFALGSALLALPQVASSQPNWQQATSYPINGGFFDPVAAGGYLYIVGGFDGAGLSNAYTAAVSADGSLGGWSATTALPAADTGVGLAIYNGWAYVALASGAVYRAPVTSGGLGTWIAETPVEPSASYSGVVKANAGHLYLFGGFGSSARNILQIAPINSDGSLGAWGVGSLPLQLFRPSVQFQGGRVYLAGGRGPSTMVVSFSYSAAVNADGTLGAWRQEADLPAPLWQQSSVLVDDKIFLFGGMTNTAMNSVSAVIFEGLITASEGRISNWVSMGSMPSEFGVASGAAFSAGNGRAYLVGGVNSSGLVTNEVWRKAFATVVVSNQPPVANPQSVTLNEGATEDITLTGSDPDNDPITFHVVNGPTNGTLSGVAPNLTYTPNTGYAGPDAFTFKVNDGQADSAAALVSIEVVEVNLPPVANSQSVSVTENGQIAITLTGSDPDHDPITFQVVSGPTNGTLSGTAPNVNYQPATNFTGADAFTFKVNDGRTDSAIATVSITVRPANSSPTASITVFPETHFPGAANLVAITPGKAVTLILDGSRSSDPDNDTLTFSWRDNGAFLATGPRTTNSLALGSHTIALVVSDGLAQDDAQVAVEVISPAQAVDLIIGLVNDSSLPRNRQRPLLASLTAAKASFEKGRMVPGTLQLKAFQNKVRAQVAKLNPDLARDLISASRAVIDAVIGKK